MLVGIIILVLIGILCGWLAGKIFRGGGFGWLVNFLVGIAGSFVVDSYLAVSSKVFSVTHSVV